MSHEPAPRPQVLNRPYRIVCLVAVGAILYVLAQEGTGIGIFLPAAVGILSLIRTWSSGPILLILTVAADLHLRHQFGLGARDVARPSDLVLCTALLAYVAAFYRLRSILIEIFPGDPRRVQNTRGARLRPAPQRRAASLVTQGEILGVVLCAPGWALAARLLWSLLPGQLEAPLLPPSLWRFTCLASILVAAFWIPSWIIDYLDRRKMTECEAAIMLQDVMWHETRREQRHINRWLAWAEAKLSTARDRLSQGRARKNARSPGPPGRS